MSPPRECGVTLIRSWTQHRFFEKNPPRLQQASQNFLASWVGELWGRCRSSEDCNSAMRARLAIFKRFVEAGRPNNMPTGQDYRKMGIWICLIWVEAKQAFLVVKLMLLGAWEGEDELSDGVALNKARIQGPVGGVCNLHHRKMVSVLNQVW